MLLPVIYIKYLLSGFLANLELLPYALFFSFLLSAAISVFTIDCFLSAVELNLYCAFGRRSIFGIYSEYLQMVHCPGPDTF